MFILEPSIKSEQCLLHSQKQLIFFFLQNSLFYWLHFAMDQFNKFWVIFCQPILSFSMTQASIILYCINIVIRFLHVNNIVNFLSNESRHIVILIATSFWPSGKDQSAIIKEIHELNIFVCSLTDVPGAKSSFLLLSSSKQLLSSVKFTFMFLLLHNR